MAYNLKNTQGILVAVVEEEQKRTDVNDLILQGKSATNWGEGINTNFIRLLENFACPESATLTGTPVKQGDLPEGTGINLPTIGQHWFNTSNSQMYFFNGVSWNQLALTTDYYTKTASDARYLRLNGNSTMVGELDMNGYKIIHLGNPTNDEDAATKHYVDTEISNISSGVSSDYYSKTASDSRFVNVSGDTMTGFLTLHANPTSAMHAATKDYVDDLTGNLTSILIGNYYERSVSDDRYVNVNSDTMTGPLILHDHPDGASPAKQAATKQYVDSAIGAIPTGIPPGMIAWYPLSTPPAGWLVCNGATINNITYSNLFAVIGYTFGGAGVNFVLPDLRGVFIRGVDNGRGLDPGRSLNSYQGDTFGAHRHYIYSDLLWGQGYNMGGGGGAQPGTGETTIVGGSETRPKNIALLPCIKY